MSQQFDESNEFIIFDVMSPTDVKATALVSRLSYHGLNKFNNLANLNP